MASLHPYEVLAYYLFCEIEDPYQEVALHRAFFEGRDATSRIYISEQGINGQCSLSLADSLAYREWMHSRNLFKSTQFKIHPWHEHVFPRLTIKYRKQLVAIDREVNLALKGSYVTPLEWKEMLERQDNHVLLDVRNDYEWELGHFVGAELPPCETFRDFEAYAENLKSKTDPQNTPVMMYCTGGIRCELYSSILREKGFLKVFQLEGGIIQYGLKEGTEHWLGKLFVFDDRLSIPIGPGEAPVIGKCHHCALPNETYYNCANMDCNCLFLCCKECIEKFKGCCQEICQKGSRLRPYHHEEAHKPFKRWHFYFPNKGKVKKTA